MAEHYADDYTMSLIAPSSPNPRVIGRWLNPDPAAEPAPEPDEVETKVVAAPRKRVSKPRAKAETA